MMSPTALGYIETVLFVAALAFQAASLGLMMWYEWFLSAPHSGRRYAEPICVLALAAGAAVLASHDASTCVKWVVIVSTLIHRWPGVRVGVDPRVCVLTHQNRLAARAWYEALLARRPKAHRARNRLATNVLAGLGDYGAAAMHLRQLVQVPGGEIMLRQLLLFLAEAGCPSDIQCLWIQFGDYVNDMRATDADRDALLGLALVRSGRTAEAAQLAPFRDASPIRTEADPRIGRTCVIAGARALCGMGRHAEALDVYEAIVDDFGRRPDTKVLAAMSSCHEELGDMDRAISTARRLIVEQRKTGVPMEQVERLIALLDRTGQSTEARRWQMALGGYGRFPL